MTPAASDVASSASGAARAGVGAADAAAPGGRSSALADGAAGSLDLGVRSRFLAAEAADWTRRIDDAVGSISSSGSSFFFTWRRSRCMVGAQPGVGRPRWEREWGTGVARSQTSVLRLARARPTLANTTTNRVAEK